MPSRCVSSSCAHFPAVRLSLSLSLSTPLPLRRPATVRCCLRDVPQHPPPSPFKAPLILRGDSVFHCIVCFSLAMAVPLAAIAGVVMALLNVSSALALNAEQLAERLHFAMQPTTWVCMVYGAVAVGAVLGSQPPEQVSHRAKVLFCALMVVIPLVADVILVVRSGDLCFLVGQVCFGMPMAATFWIVASSQGSRKQSASAKQIAHAAQVSFGGCHA